MSQPPFFGDRRRSAVAVLLLLTTVADHWNAAASYAAPPGVGYDNDVTGSVAADDAGRRPVFELPVINKYLPNRESYGALDGRSGNFRSRDGAPFPVGVSDVAMRDDGELAPEWYNDGRKVSLGTDLGFMDERQLSDFRGDSSSAGTTGGVRSKKRVHFGFHAIRGKRFNARTNRQQKTN